MKKCICEKVTDRINKIMEYKGKDSVSEWRVGGEACRKWRNFNAALIGSGKCAEENSGIQKGCFCPLCFRFICGECF